MDQPIGTIRINHFEPRSRANGPGLRAVLWVQGCSLGCPGCFNPETHSRLGGHELSHSEIVTRLKILEREGIEGVTISGGEPLQQWKWLWPLLRRIQKETDLTILVFTGYRWDEIPDDIALALSYLTDIVIAGRYDDHQRIAAGLIGSANKEPRFFSTRYGPDDLDAVPPAEVIIGSDGSLVFSGIDPLDI